jgi:hypothetical protein
MSCNSRSEMMEVEEVKELIMSQEEQRKEKENFALHKMYKMYLLIQEELQNHDADYFLISSSIEFYYYSIVRLCHGEKHTIPFAIVSFTFPVSFSDLRSFEAQSYC